MKANIFFSSTKKETVAINPLIFPVIVVLLCVARWGLIANGFDYGWDFETGYRVYRGGIYGKDFYTAVGPLSYELIGFIFKVLSPSFIYLNFCYYACWTLSVLGCYLLVQKISTRPENTACAFIVTAPLSIPHMFPLHLYNFLSYTIAIWVFVFCFKFLETRKIKVLFLAGLLSGIAIFTKQNIGIGAIGLAILILIINSILDLSQSVKETIRDVLVLLLGLLTSSLIIVYFYSENIGVTEFIKLVFIDSAKAKGNALNMLKVALPRLTFGVAVLDPASWRLQHIKELSACIFVILINVFWFRGLLFTKKNSRALINFEVSNYDLALFVGFFILFMALTFIFPTYLFQLKTKIFWFRWYHPQIEVVTPILFWICGVFFAFWFLTLGKVKNISKEFFKYRVLLSVLAFGLHVWICAASFKYVLLNTSLLLSIVLIGGLNLKLGSRGQVYLLYIALLLGGYIGYPTNAFGPLQKLQGNSMHWMLGSKNVQLGWDEYQIGLRNYVDGKKTLFLIHGGPHSLSGAIPVRNISNIYFDQYNPRIEESLVKGWMVNPPEMIVRGFFVPAEGSQWLVSERFESWIKNNYLQVAEISEKRIFQYRF